MTCGDGAGSAVIPREPQQVKLLVDCVDSVATWEGFGRSWKLFGGWWLSRRFPTSAGEPLQVFASGTKHEVMFIRS